jgi:hypothetical protein
MSGVFPKEADLCAAYCKVIPDNWIVYPETAGFDMLVVERSTGVQIGVEAKLRLNSKVLIQAGDLHHRAQETGPDFRAVLVPEIKPTERELAVIATHLGITVITCKPWVRSQGYTLDSNRRNGFIAAPGLPDVAKTLKPKDWLDAAWWRTKPEWFDLAPVSRLSLPEYVPEVPAGVPAPMVLSDWKIKAIKVCVFVLAQGSVNRGHFKALAIDPSRWMDGHWLMRGSPRGEWVPGPRFPAEQWRRDHPNVFAQIEADFAKWGAPLLGPKQESML